jgi:hypothetical protein
MIQKNSISVARTAQLTVEVKEPHNENHTESMLNRVGKTQSVFKFLAENQLDAPLLIDLFILFFNFLHVSGTMWPSSGETNCVNTASVIVNPYCCPWLVTIGMLMLTLMLNQVVHYCNHCALKGWINRLKQRGVGSGQVDVLPYLLE